MHILHFSYLHICGHPKKNSCHNVWSDLYKQNYIFHHNHVKAQNSCTQISMPHKTDNLHVTVTPTTKFISVGRTYHIEGNHGNKHNNPAFWCVIQCHTIQIYQCFGEPCLHFQDTGVNSYQTALHLNYCIL